MTASRRDFLQQISRAGLACAAAPFLASFPTSSARALGFPDPGALWRGDSSVAAALRAGVLDAPTIDGAPPAQSPIASIRRLVQRFPDLRRHFIFEYYPWYFTNPYRHWDQADRRPPIDIASNYMPKLGAYDSRSIAVLEQHAQWINELGAGAINVSWWGKDSDTDQVIPTLMDVMKAHDIRVTFHLEPYTDRHAQNYADDIEYLVTKYGDKRGWDCFLVLRHADNTSGPVFKSFRTILPADVPDCHGVRTPVPDYTADAVWREQTDSVRARLSGQFNRVTLLADSLEMGRTRAAGFDGIAVYDNFVSPKTWPRWAHDATAVDLVFSFNINPGVDDLPLRNVDPSSCYTAPLFEPGRKQYDWSRASNREAAARASASRIAQSMQATVALQSDPKLSNVRRGFFLTYINSFNEWHEGHQFEPMKDRAELSPAELTIGYHNPADGLYRWKALSALLAPALRPRTTGRGARP
jgi:hypothetical protein